MFRYSSVALFLSVFLMTGCFEVEQTITLEKDFSGKAGFSMVVDMEPMVVIMAQIQHDMDGKKGPLTAAELDKARADFLAKNKAGSSADLDKKKAEVQSSLPKGVTLLNSSIRDEGMKITANLLFGFDKISKLSQIALPSKTNGTDKSPKNPVESPFAGLTLVDEGETMLVTIDIQNPKAGAEKDAGGMELTSEMKAMIEDAFKNLRVTTKIKAPFEVVDDNSTRKEGDTLIWEYKLDSLSKMTPEQLTKGIRVRYKK